MTTDKQAKHRIFISLGTNIERDLHVRVGLDALHAHFAPLILSSVYESEAVGFDGSPFYNMVIEANTELTIDQVCLLLKQIEDANGRKRGGKKFSPRTLDLDLLLYDDVVQTDGVVLPREEILYNAFVLQPMAEVAPHLCHPLDGRSYIELWQAYDKTKQSLWTIDFTWSPSKHDPV